MFDVTLGLSSRRRGGGFGLAACSGGASTLGVCRVTCSDALSTGALIGDVTGWGFSSIKRAKRSGICSTVTGSSGGAGTTKTTINTINPRIADPVKQLRKARSMRPQIGCWYRCVMLDCALAILRRSYHCQGDVFVPAHGTGEHDAL